MYARVSTSHGPVGDIDEATAKIVAEILPAARQLDGFQGVFSLVDPHGNKSLTITLWASEEAMRASEEQANQIRQQAATLTGSDVVNVERYQIAYHELKTQPVATT